MTLPPPSPPPYVNLLEPFRFFTAGDQLVVPRGVTHISATIRIRSRGQEKIKQTNKHEQNAWGYSRAEGVMQHYISDSIYGLTLAWITSENSTKQLECRHLLTRSSLTASAPLSNQLSSRVPLPLPATPRFQVQKPFVWFRAKTDKGIVCLAGHLYSVTVWLVGVQCKYVPNSGLYRGICCTPYLTGKCGTRPFFRWVRAQGRSPRALGISQKCLRPPRHSPY